MSEVLKKRGIPKHKIWVVAEGNQQVVYESRNMEAEIHCLVAFSAALSSDGIPLRKTPGFTPVILL